MSNSIEINGVPAVRAMLAKWQDPALSKRAQAAAKVGATTLKAPLQEAVRPLSKRMAASVYVHVAKRDRPAYVVGHHRSKAFFWPFVIGGTKAHSTSARDGHRSGPFVRGVPAHPVVDKVAQEHGQQALDAMLKALSDS